MSIDFTDNKHGNFALSAIYLWYSIKHLGLGIWGCLNWMHERVIKRYTLACMAAPIPAHYQSPKQQQQ